MAPASNSCVCVAGRVAILVSVAITVGVHGTGVWAAGSGVLLALTADVGVSVCGTVVLPGVWLNVVVRDGTVDATGLVTSTTATAASVALCEGVSVAGSGVCVFVAVLVNVSVGVSVGDSGVTLDSGVKEGVLLAVLVNVALGVGVTVFVVVCVNVLVGVTVNVEVGVSVPVAVSVAVSV